jgi:hypothetical protein
MSADLYYIQNRPCVGNCARWWREGGHGYTCDLREAWKVDLAQAQSICRSRPAEYVPYRVADVDHVSVVHVDVQALRHLKAERE